MSVRICLPSNRMRPAASYARSRASAALGAQPGHVQHPAARGHDRAVRLRRARVEDVRVEPVEAGDLVPVEYAPG